MSVGASTCFSITGKASAGLQLSRDLPEACFSLSLPRARPSPLRTRGKYAHRAEEVEHLHRPQRGAGGLLILAHIDSASRDGTDANCCSLAA
eukprot:1764010-Pleurochrysis_carterae.AAC.1